MLVIHFSFHYFSELFIIQKQVKISDRKDRRLGDIGRPKRRSFLFQIFTCLCFTKPLIIILYGNFVRCFTKPLFIIQYRNFVRYSFLIQKCDAFIFIISNVRSRNVPYSFSLLSHYSVFITPHRLPPPPRPLALRYFSFIFNEPFLAFKVSLNRKVEAIIECFLDSATPPWLQVFGSFVIEDFRHLMGRVMGHSCRTSCTQACFRMVTRFQVKLKDSFYIK